MDKFWSGSESFSLIYWKVSSKWMIFETDLCYVWIALNLVHFFTLAFLVENNGREILHKFIEKWHYCSHNMNLKDPISMLSTKILPKLNAEINRIFFEIQFQTSQQNHLCINNENWALILWNCDAFAKWIYIDATQMLMFNSSSRYFDQKNLPTPTSLKFYTFEIEKK